ncbi:MAG: SDR family NAD(P)-dependent oxidoreductase [Bacteroidetes bacterium]|jgi:NAD(P)-dependent dehydrogenase (short-subunit alcohol dehydrogenase family)|nr:SDR family NAD(P)-dependent oxidoreductase [Bacteroidota bacterium]
MNDKIALVTGANKGLGLEVVKQMYEKGYQVILTSRDKDKGMIALKDLEKPDNVWYHPLDVTSEKSVSAVCDYIKNKFGKLDVLVNNAGINYDTWQNAVNADLSTVKETIETNLIAAWRMAQAVLPFMIEKNYGRIVNVSSGSGAISGMTGGTPGYAVSKAGMNVLTIKLAADLRHKNILVNSVCPGWVRTDMGGSNASRSIPEGAKGIVHAATLPDNGPSGGFFRDGRAIDF